MAEDYYIHDEHSKAYADAVWDYVLEHSDIAPGGALFVKFHTKSKKTLDDHIKARVNGYHRGDPRQKELLIQSEKERRKAIHEATKEKAAQKKAEKKARRKGIVLPLDKQKEALRLLQLNTTCSTPKTQESVLSSLQEWLGIRMKANPDSTSSSQP